MSSTSLGDKKCRSTWDGLPAEIRLLILEAVVATRCELSPLATVSREWQTEIERHNFAQIRLTPARVVDFGSMVHRNRALVRYIWFCLELDGYSCESCTPSAARGFTSDTLSSTCSVGGYPITTVFKNLFSALSSWDPHGQLKLDISIYSPSDAEHWFKYLTFVPDIPKDTLGGREIEQAVLSRNIFHDHYHGWDGGFRRYSPPRTAILKVFAPVMAEGPFKSEQLEHQWWDQLPSVPVVTSLLLRQQNRRRWKPRALAHMFSRFPRLEEVHYEPWRQWDFSYWATDQREYNCRLPGLLLVPRLLLTHTLDLEYESLFESIQSSNSSLKRLVIFENFNQQYPAVMQNFWGMTAQCPSTRRPEPAVSRMVARASLKLEHLAASFIVDASQFFEVESTWVWPNLTSLALTSTSFTPDGNAAKIGAIFLAAAAAAKRMPRLETMEIWNGRKGIAALFKYQASRDRRPAIITWRRTWQLTIEKPVIEAWKAVVDQYDGWGLKLVEEWVDESAIKSHGDAIQHLALSSQVIRPISLQQIRTEQKFLDGVKTV